MPRCPAPIPKAPTRVSSRTKTPTRPADAAPVIPAAPRTPQRKAKSNRQAVNSIQTPTATPTLDPATLMRSPRKTKGAVAPAPSAAVLLGQSLQTTDQWYRATRTLNGYASYVKAAKTWLREWIEQGNLTEEVEGETLEGANERRRFANAFDSITAETALVLRLYTTFKCDVANLGYATAEGIRSAFKSYFERQVV